VKLLTGPCAKKLDGPVKYGIPGNSIQTINSICQRSAAKIVHSINEHEYETTRHAVLLTPVSEATSDEIYSKGVRITKPVYAVITSLVINLII